MVVECKYLPIAERWLPLLLFLQDNLNPFRSSMFISIYLLLTLSIQNKCLCCENIRTDHIVQAFQYEKRHFPKLFKGKYGHHLGDFSNTSFFVFGAERFLTQEFALDCCQPSLYCEYFKQSRVYVQSGGLEIFIFVFTTTVSR